MNSILSIANTHVLARQGVESCCAGATDCGEIGAHTRARIDQRNQRFKP